MEMLEKEKLGKKMLKTVSVAMVSLGLVMGVSAVDSVSAAPTQKPKLTCVKTGSTTLEANGSVVRVEFRWYKNSTTTSQYQVGYIDDQTGPGWSAPTPNTAKTAKATVHWSSGGTTDYTATCK